MLSKATIILNIINTILILFILSVLYGKNNTITETSSVKPYFDTVLSVNDDIKNHIKEINGVKPILNDKTFNAAIGKELEANKEINEKPLGENMVKVIEEIKKESENKVNLEEPKKNTNDLDKNIAIVEEKLKQTSNEQKTQETTEVKIEEQEVKKVELSKIIKDKNVVNEDYIQKETINRNNIPLLITFDKVANTKLKGNMKIMVAKNKTYDYYKLRYKDQDFLIHSKYIK